MSTNVAWMVLSVGGHHWTQFTESSPMSTNVAWMVLSVGGHRWTQLTESSSTYGMDGVECWMHMIDPPFWTQLSNEYQCECVCTGSWRGGWQTLTVS